MTLDLGPLKQAVADAPRPPREQRVVKAGVIQSFEFTYDEARNRTSHTYDTETADEIFSAARPFLSSARALLSAFSSSPPSA